MLSHTTAEAGQPAAERQVNQQQRGRSTSSREAGQPAAERQVNQQQRGRLISSREAGQPAAKRQVFNSVETGYPIQQRDCVVLLQRRYIFKT